MPGAFGAWLAASGAAPLGWSADPATFVDSLEACGASRAPLFASPEASAAFPEAFAGGPRRVKRRCRDVH